MDDPEDAYIRISLRGEANQLVFRVENTRPGQTITQPFGSGIGLENVRKRLNLIYPCKHSLIIHDSIKIFRIELKIDLYENQMPHR